MLKIANIKKANYKFERCISLKFKEVEKFLLKPLQFSAFPKPENAQKVAEIKADET